VPVENVTPINAPPAEVMKFVVTAGVTSIENKLVAGNVELDN
jgi:hypothetical protein